MAPLSTVPGRVRLENRRLVGNPGVCGLLENRILAVRGVAGVSANPRTGRVLITFDENVIRWSELSRDIKLAMETVEKTDIRCQIPHPAETHRNSAASQRAWHLVMHLATHAFVPKPYRILIDALGAFHTADQGSRS